MPAGGRPRKGTLVWQKRGWAARIWTLVDDEWIRVTVPLGTTNKVVAKRKMAREVEKANAGAEVDAAEAQAVETFADAATRIVSQQGREGVKTWRERLSTLQRHVPEHIQSKRIDAIRPADVRETLEAARDAGLSKQSVIHLRNAMSSVLDALWRDEVIAENPVKRVRVPKGCRVDNRPRVSPDDDEFARFMACADVPEHVHLMALASRAFGGMRTSDLHAWDWSHIDTEAFAFAQVYRPKTAGAESGPAILEEIILPDVLRGPLVAWWTRWGKLTTGPVFPVMGGKRAGERQSKRSHARDLRDGFWAAGVHRPMPGFPEALAALQRATEAVEQARGQGRRAWWQAQRDRREAEEAAKALDAIQTDSPTTRRLDFHSLRRSYNTALAAAGVNVQQAMALAGHKNPKTHMRYVQLAQRGPLTQPESALPLLPSTPGNDAGVLSVARTELVAGSDVSPGDPSETRTRVTGVRGRCPNR